MHNYLVRDVLFTAAAILRASPSTHWEAALDIATVEICTRANQPEARAAILADATERYRASRGGSGTPKHIVATAAELRATGEIAQENAQRIAAYGLPTGGQWRGRLMVYLSTHSGACSGAELTVGEAADALDTLRRLGICPDHVTWVGQLDDGRIGSVALQIDSACDAT